MTGSYLVQFGKPGFVGSVLLECCLGFVVPYAVFANHMGDPLDLGGTFTLGGWWRS